ncbi:DUF1524 domain-containing protein [Cellulomonas sp. APG4]|uniref:GmrSD restriction endonuclease domain-containing protein n=1 Tax=Cellulomonas sp. APG4 TaxID=1538656 RepID=UPI00351B5B8B
MGDRDVRRGLSAVVALLVTASLTACTVEAVTHADGEGSPAATTSAPRAEPSPAATGEPGLSAGAALDAVGRLEVKGRAPRTGYERDLFGEGWVDVDRNGCDTRNDVLGRDLTDVTTKPGTRGCVVLTGILLDPYSGATLAFVRGAATSSDVQVDHVVALADAWQKGAWQWDGPTRVAFANDPLNLLAVDGALNQQKGAGDAATWLPPSKPYRCAYVARQVAVKHAYGLWVTEAERDAMARVLTGCPAEPLPVATGPVPGAPPAPPSDDAVVPFASCADARAAGAAPVLRGDPGYGPHLDGDDDGVGCE